MASLSKDRTWKAVKGLKWHKAQCHRQWRGSSMDFIVQRDPAEGAVGEEEAAASVDGEMPSPSQSFTEG